MTSFLRPAPALFLPALLLSNAGCWASHERGVELGDPEIAGSASLAIDGTSVYWADTERHAIFAAPRGGGPARRLAPADPALYAPLAVTETDVLWVDSADGVSVWRVPLAGGPRARVAVAHGGPIGLGADAEHAYFSGTETGFDLVDVTLATGTARVIDDDLPALALRLDGGELVGTTCGTNGVWSIRRDDTGRRTLVAGTFCPITLAIDERFVYWQDYAELSGSAGGSAIFRAPRTGGGVPERVLVNDTLAFAVHRSSVYTFLDSELVRVTATGVEVVAPTEEDVRGIAVDDDFVYWTSAGPDAAVDLFVAPRPR